MDFRAEDGAAHFRVSREFARRQIRWGVIPSGSRGIPLRKLKAATPDRLGSARVSRAGDDVSSSRTSLERLFRRDAETDTRDACATHSHLIEKFKVMQRIPRLHSGLRKTGWLGGLFLLAEAPTSMRHPQLGDIFGIERDVRVAAHRRHERTLRNRHVVKDATVL